MTIIQTSQKKSKKSLCNQRAHHLAWEGERCRSEPGCQSLPDNWQTGPGNTSFQLLLQRVSLANCKNKLKIKNKQFDLLFDVHFVIFIFSFHFRFRFSFP